MRMLRLTTAALSFFAAITCGGKHVKEADKAWAFRSPRPTVDPSGVELWQAIPIVEDMPEANRPAFLIRLAPPGRGAAVGAHVNGALVRVASQMPSIAGLTFSSVFPPPGSAGIGQMRLPIRHHLSLAF